MARFRWQDSPHNFVDGHAVYCRAPWAHSPIRTWCESERPNSAAPSRAYRADHPDETS